MSARKREGDVEIARLFALHRQHVAKVDAGDLTKKASDIEHEAGKRARRRAARTPASGLAGLLEKVDYIISEDALVDVDADLTLTALRADLARMLEEQRDGAPIARELAHSIVLDALSDIWHSTVWIPVIARLLGEALNASDTDGAVFLSNCLAAEAAKLEERYETSSNLYAEPEKKTAKKGGAK